MVYIAFYSPNLVFLLLCSFVFIPLLFFINCMGSVFGRLCVRVACSEFYVVFVGSIYVKCTMSFPLKYNVPRDSNITESYTFFRVHMRSQKEKKFK